MANAAAVAASGPTPLDKIYPGPRSFQTDESGIFFGREREAADLRNLLLSYRTVLLYSQSGAGKSSLVRAGLLGKLNKGYWLLARVQGQEPHDASANIYAHNVLLTAGKEIRDGSTRLAGALRRDSEEPWYLILDQFEELFTAYPERWRDREDFFRELREVLDSDQSVRILFVCREEYIAELDRYSPYFIDGFRIRYRLERLNENAALEAITRPADKSGQPANAGVMRDLAPELVRSLRRVPVRTRHGTNLIEGEFIEPVHLQIVCRDLWSALQKGRASSDEIRKYVDVDRTLQTYYETAISRAAGSRLWRRPLLREWFEKNLITPAGTRGNVYLNPDTGKAAGTSAAVVKALEAEHMLRMERRAGSEWYELTHDRFIRPILDSNRRWRRETLRQGLALVLGALLALGGFGLFHASQSARTAAVQQQELKQASQKAVNVARSGVTAGMQEWISGDREKAKIPLAAAAATDSWAAIQAIEQQLHSAAGQRDARTFSAARACRRWFLGYISDPGNASRVEVSTDVHSYICSHNSVVGIPPSGDRISETAKNVLLRGLNDQFPGATVLASRVTPGYSAVAIDYLLSPEEAEEVREKASRNLPNSRTVIYPYLLDCAAPGGTWGVVWSGDANLDGARYEVTTISQKLGLPNPAIYHRDGSFRSVSVVSEKQEAEQLLTKARMRRADAFVIDLTSWCQGAQLRSGYLECPGGAK